MTKWMMLAALPAFAHADEWISIGSVEADPATIQGAVRTDTKAPIAAVWVRIKAMNTAWQVWVDCGMRQAQTYGESFYGGAWSPWTPIAPESINWDVMQYLCKPKHKGKAQQ